MILHGVDPIEGEREEGLLQIHRIGVDGELFGRGFEASFGAHELKTFVVPRAGGEVRETDLLER